MSKAGIEHDEQVRAARRAVTMMRSAVGELLAMLEAVDGLLVDGSARD